MQPEDGVAGAVATANAATGFQLKQLALSFLRLGAIAFGGPAAHIAMMEEEFVRRRGWVSRADFLDMLGVQLNSGSQLDRDGDSYRPSTSWLEGPHCRRHVLRSSGHTDRDGLRVGLCRIWSASANSARAVWHQTCHYRHRTAGSLATGAPPSRACFGGYCLIATVAALAGGNVLVVLLVAGLVATLQAWSRERPACANLGPLSIQSFAATVAAAPAAVPIGLGGLFLLFLKFGAVIFGSGYVLLVFLQTDLVNRLHWLSQAQLLDAVAVGQVIPGRYSPLQRSLAICSAALPVL